MIGIVGLGNMGYAIYKSLCDKYAIQVFDPYVKQKYPEISFCNSISELEKENIVILAVKPNKVVEVLREFQSPHIYISIAAGVKISTLKENSHANSTIVRLMPNLPLVANEGAIGMFGDEKGYNTTKELFSSLGKIIELPNEELMDAVTALSGSGPAYVFSFLHAMAEGGLKCGLSYDMSLELALQTLKGSVIYIEKLKKENSFHHLAELRNKVTSPAGTTIYGLEVLEEKGFHASVMKAIFSAYQRAKELG